jgi:hypothetical protein
MPSLDDAYADREQAWSGVRLAVALALVLAGSVVAALGLVDAAASALVAVGVPTTLAGRLGVVAGGLVLPATLAALHAVVPSSRRLRRAATAGVALAAVGPALHALGAGTAATVAYGVGVLAALWSLVAAATTAIDRPSAAVAPADAPAIDVDRQLYDDRSRVGERVTPADGGTDDDEITPLLDDADE